MICPQCGVFLTPPMHRIFNSKATRELIDDQDVSCFCFVPTNELQKIHEKADRQLEEFYKKNFRFWKRRDIENQIRKMDRGLPLRAEAIRRIAYLKRLQEELNKRFEREKQEGKEGEERKKAEAEARVMKGVRGFLKDVL